MKVKELIEVLLTMPQESHVVSSDEQWGDILVGSVEKTLLHSNDGNQIVVVNLQPGPYPDDLVPFH